MFYKEYQLILDEIMLDNNVKDVQHLSNESILINKLAKDSTINGIAGIQNFGKERIT
jgi:hypothetical protein